MTIKHSIRLLTLAVVPLLWGCGADEETAGKGVAAAATPLECQRMGFACTWGEVPPAVKERTVILGEIAGLYGVNASLAEIADFLLEQPGVVYTEVLGTGVRYRIEGGRPAWVYPRDELAHHSADPALNQESGEPGTNVTFAPVGPALARAMGQIGRWLGPSLAHAQSVDEADRHGVAADIAGGPKRALILSPFEWEWLLKRIEHSGEAMARLAALIKDYQPEHGGEVVFHADVYQFEDNPLGPQMRVQLSDEVQFADFLNWNTFNTIVLATHGTRHRCSREPPVGGKKIPIDPVDSPPGDTSDDCPLIWAGRAKQSDYGAYVGVEIISFVGMEYREFPGLTRPEAAQCVEDLHTWRQAGKKGSEPTTLDGKPCRLGRERGKDMIALWTPFFEAQYPEGLKEVILFLASCRSAVNDVLLKQFAQEGNDQVAVFGFDDAVADVDGFRLAYKMIELIEKGVDNQTILKALKQMDRSRTGHLRGRALALGDEPLPAKPAELLEVSRGLTHGRDIVMLVNPAGTELKSGASVRVESIDEQTDQLDLQAQIIGLEDEMARALQMQVRVLGEPVPDNRYRPTINVEQWVNRTSKKVSLGRKHEEGEKVDLEVSVGFPGGNDSRWVYKDITLTGAACSWSVTVSGESPAQGTYYGTVGSVKLDENGGEPWTNHATIKPDDPRPEAPWMAINLLNSDVKKMLNDPGFISQISFDVPGSRQGQTGTWNRIWGTIYIGTESYRGTADYLRRNLVGLPEGSGIGLLLTSNITISRNDDERVEGSFEARFLNENRYRELDDIQQAPLGVGVHPIPQATITARGEFNLQAPTGCKNDAFINSVRKRFKSSS